MFDAGWLNIGSLLLGILAWIIPVFHLIRYRERGFRQVYGSSLISLSACAVSLVLQLYYNKYLASIGDWSALLDTVGGVAFVSMVLTTATILLNIALWRICIRNNNERNEP